VTAKFKKKINRARDTEKKMRTHKERKKERKKRDIRDQNASG